MLSQTIGNSGHAGMSVGCNGDSKATLQLVVSTSVMMVMESIG